MTGKRCTDCKYTKGIGYDFWCDEGHTEYEVFGAETNCPYYEYHDWSKGIPSKIEKRFTGEFDKQYGGVHDNGEQLTNFEVVDLLNNLSEENMELKERNEFLELLTTHRGEMVSMANSIIQDLPNTPTAKAQEIWYEFKEEMYQEWKKKRWIK